MYSPKLSVLCNGELPFFICSIQLFRFGQRICLQGFNSSETLLRATHVLEDVKINKYLYKNNIWISQQIAIIYFLSNIDVCKLHKHLLDISSKRQWPIFPGS